MRLMAILDSFSWIWILSRERQSGGGTNLIREKHSFITKTWFLYTAARLSLVLITTRAIAVTNFHSLDQQ